MKKNNCIKIKTLKKVFLGIGVFLALQALPTSGNVASAQTVSSGGFIFDVGSLSASVTGYNGTETDITIPTSVNGKQVTGIANDAFSSETNISSITSTTVTSIGDRAFSGCSSLSKVDISSAKSIGTEAFVNCPSLSQLHIQSIVKSVGDHAFGFNKNTGGKYSVASGLKLFTIFSANNKAYAFALANGINVSSYELQLVSVSTNKKSYIYTGKSIKPKLTVKSAAGDILDSMDYKVTYKKNKVVGTATVIVSGKNSYWGSVSTTFKILPDKLRLTSVKSPKAKQLLIKWVRDYSGTGYQVQYSTNNKFKKSSTRTVTVKKSKYSCKIRKLKAGRTYYVRVRTYKKIGNTYYYGTWSNVGQTLVRK